MPEPQGEIEVTRDQVTVDPTGSIMVINNKDLATSVQRQLDEVREQESTKELYWGVQLTIRF